MTITGILVPYHLDEHLPDLDVPLGPHRMVEAELAGGDVWSRLTALFDAVAGAVAVESRPLVVSGDCLTSVGTMAGLQRAGLDPAVVWFDAHGDVQTLETTASGYLGGIPLRLLTGYRPELAAAALGLRPVAPQRVLLVGARDLDPPETEFLAGSPMGRAEVAEVAADGLPDGPIYLHVDLDVIDPDSLAGLRFPAPDGPDLDTVAAAMERILDTGRVCAVGLACTWRPGRHNAAKLDARLADALRDWA